MEMTTRRRQNNDYDTIIEAADPIPVTAPTVERVKQDKVTLSTTPQMVTLDDLVSLQITNRSTAIIYSSMHGNEDGEAQVETNTIASAVTLGGNLSVVVTAAGMAGTPKTIAAAALGTLQKESITCTAAVTSAGDIELEITAAVGVAWSPATVTVTLTTGDDTVTKVAEKCVLAINADTDVAGDFIASNVAGAVTITALVAAADDATMAFAFTDTDSTSVTFGASADTTAGVAASTAAEIAEIVKDALNADGVIGAFFTATRSGDDVIITAASAIANDATMNLAVATGTATGLTASPTSANTTAGYLAGDWDELGGSGTINYDPPSGYANGTPFTFIWIKSSTGTPAVILRGWKVV